MLIDEPRFVWLDLEMTGLNVATDVILEFAMVVTGPPMEPIAELERVVYQPEEALNAMSDRVKKMHTDNGLLEEVRASTTSLLHVEREALRLLGAHCHPGQAILCGSSVHLDRKFMAKYMPRVEQHLHFHQVDIATISILMAAFFPEKRLDERFPRPPTKHRAMPDVRASLEEMRFYCERGFGVDFAALKRPR